MNVREIVTGTSARFLSVPPLVGGKLFGIHLVRALEERYGFLVGPKTLDDFDLQKGITFYRGYLTGQNTLSSVEFYHNGIKAESSEGTIVADQFIDDVVSWLAKDAGLDIGPSGDLRIYSSVIEAEMSVAFGEKLSQFADIGEMIGRFVKGYGGPETAYEATGLMMWTPIQNKGPGLFRIERRVDQPFPANIFFSAAPLTTPDHLKTLEAIERLLT